MLIVLLFVIIVDKSVAITSSSASICPGNCTCHYEPTSLSIICDQNVPQETKKQIDSILQTASADRITNITIRNASLTMFPTPICRFSLLEALDLQYNQIIRLSRDCLRKLANIVFLNVAHNNVSALSRGLFDGLPKLRELNLSHNRISNIGLEVFHNESELAGIRYINVANNRLHSVDIWPFVRGLVANRQNARARIHVEYNSISRFTNLLNLTFDCRLDVTMAADMFFDVSGNNFSRLTDIGRGWGIDLVECLCHIDDESPSSSYCLSSVAGRSIPFVCDCKDFDFYKLIKWYKFSSLLFKTKCYTPSDLRGKDINKVKLRQFTCEVTANCPHRCNECLYRPEDSSLEVNCSSSDYHLLPTQVPRLPAENVSYVLDFSNSRNLSRLDWRPYHVNTSVINVSGCAVVAVDEKLWNGTRLLKALLLDHNRMQSLPLSTETDLSPSMRLSLGNNLWTCYCNDSWMITWLTRIKDRLIDSIDIQCYTPLQLSEKRILQLTPDDLCPIPREDELPRLGAFSLLALVLVIIMLTILGATLYRVRVQLYKKWNIHPFDRDECVGEDMEYDVFLCSSSQDYETLSRSILEELESRGFKVCFHERDFRGGESIEVNMCRAIERSKRTLCVVSENFLRSRYCMREFDISLNHIVTVMNKTRLVVLMVDSPSVLLESSELDEVTALRQYISLYTYIDCKSENWLDRLIYALPINGMLRKQPRCDGGEGLAQLSCSSTSDVCIIVD